MFSSGPFEYHVVGIGNAIVDVLAKTDDAFLERHNLVKGSMNLIDEEMAHALYGEMGPAREISGGSAANTVAGIAALGGKSAFIGKIADDELGEIEQRDEWRFFLEVLCQQGAHDGDYNRGDRSEQRNGRKHQDEGQGSGAGVFPDDEG